MKAKKILHIEDSSFFMEEIKDFFKSQREVIIKNVVSNTDALKTLKEDEFDLIILDGNLIDGKSTIVLEYLITTNYDKSKVMLHSGDIALLIDAQKKGFTNLCLKSDGSSLVDQLKNCTSL